VPFFVPIFYLNKLNTFLLVYRQFEKVSAKIKCLKVIFRKGKSFYLPCNRKVIVCSKIVEHFGNLTMIFVLKRYFKITQINIDT